MKTDIKLLTKIAFLVFILGLCFWTAAQNQNQTQSLNRVAAGGERQPDREEQKPGAQTREKTISLPEEESPMIEEDDFIIYDQEIWSRKLFQKKLPPLDKKEKIIWAFRMAETNTFL
jgi:hypothetical protein